MTDIIILCIITWQKGFLCHRSTTLEFTTSRYPKFEFFTNFPFQAQNTPLQNCIPSLGSFPSPWTVYPDFDSCYSHFMPYRMTPSVRHRAIEVHYYYYYYYYYAQIARAISATLYARRSDAVNLNIDFATPLKKKSRQIGTKMALLCRRTVYTLYAVYRLLARFGLSMYSYNRVGVMFWCYKCYIYI